MTDHKSKGTGRSTESYTLEETIGRVCQVLPRFGEAKRSRLLIALGRHRPPAALLDEVGPIMVERGLVRIDHVQTHRNHVAEMWMWIGDDDDVVSRNQSVRQRSAHARCDHPARPYERRKCRQQRGAA